MKRTWIAMFSHTGGEIESISTKLKRYPDKIITNQIPGRFECALKEYVEINYSRRKPEPVEYHRMFARGEPIITLHGWMRIIPGIICDEYDIYNLHPGDIVKYPELKGKDPQQRAWDDEYKTVGCVLHRAIGEVDSGDIVQRRWTRNKFDTFEDMNNKLRALSEDMWVKFLREELDKEV